MRLYNVELCCLVCSILPPPGRIFQMPRFGIKVTSKGIIFFFDKKCIFRSNTGQGCLVSCIVLVARSGLLY